MTDKLAGLSTLRESLDTFLISSVLNAKDLSTLQGSTAGLSSFPPIEVSD